MLGITKELEYNSFLLFESFQKWKRYHNNKMLRHVTYDLCIDSSRHRQKGLTAEKCDEDLQSQYWRFTLDS